MNFNEAILVKSKSYDYYILPEPVQKNFCAESPKFIQRKICNELNKSEIMEGCIGFGSAEYERGRKLADIDVVGLSASKRPFRTFFLLSENGKEPRYRVEPVGESRAFSNLMFTGRSELNGTISGKMGLFSIVIPSVFKKSRHSKYARLSCVDALDLTRRIVHDEYEEGAISISVEDAFHQLIKIEALLNPLFFIKPRLGNGLELVMKENLQRCLQEMDGILVKKEKGKYRILENVGCIKKEPLDMKPSYEKLKESNFKIENVYPIIDEMWEKFRIHSKAIAK